MKIALSGADLEGVDVDLGVAGETIRVRSAKALQGVLEQSDGKVALSNVVAESVELEALRMVLGELVLAAPHGARLGGLGMSLDQTDAQLTLAATVGELEARELDIQVGDVRVRGRAKLAAPNLVVHGDEGSLASSHLQITGFSLQLGAVLVAAEALRGVSVKILWGAAGFRLAATAVEATALSVTLADVEVAAKGVSVISLTVDTKQITVERAAIESGAVNIQLHAAAAAATAPPAPASPAPTTTTPAREATVLALETLDRVSGELDVDVAVDLTVPIIGHRKATHRLRIAIDQGTIDYQAVEHNLAKLEDALLDFSVRDDALVLERVNPLHPTRGHGKPVVIWDVEGTDLDLAKASRVRLSVLPKARLATEGSSPPPPVEVTKTQKPSPIALRELGLLRINTRLALAPPTAEVDGQVRLLSAGALTLAGNVFHEPGGSREGSLLGEAKDLSLRLAGLALGASRLTAAGITAAELAPIEVTFRDVALDKLSVCLAGLSLEGVVLTL